MAEAGAAAEAYNKAVEDLEQATADATAAAATASDALEVAEAADLALSQHAAELFQGGSSTGQLEVFFGDGGPGTVLDRAIGVDVVGAERARLLAGAETKRNLSDALRRAADEAADRKAEARATAESAMRLAEAQAEKAKATAAQVEARREQALAELAQLRSTSVQLERERQAGLIAQEEARRAREARQRAEAAERARRKEQARQAEAARRAARGRSGRQQPAPAPSSKPTTKPAPAPAPRSGAEAAIAFAKAQLGEPYRWGATGPNSWDCSGLTMGAWARGGVRLGHYTGTQYRQTRRVPISQLRRGDLVFFGYSTRNITHVGLYVGGGQMIHAPHTGDVVRYASIYKRKLLPYGGRP